MSTIFLTGATGTVGTQVLESLRTLAPDSCVVVGTRHPERLESSVNTEYRLFDFEDPTTFAPALEGTTRVFFLRPPLLAKQEIFEPFVRALETLELDLVTFLSVAGAERIDLLPHAKIEKLLDATSLSTYFVRPEYFMSNLVYPFGPEINQNRQITLPSADAEFNWIDPADIGYLVALSLQDPDKFRGRRTHLTGPTNHNFESVCSLLSKALETKVTYRPVNPLRFWWSKRASKGAGFATILTIIHTLPRFVDAPQVNDEFRTLTGQVPTPLQDYIDRHQDTWR